MMLARRCLWAAAFLTGITQAADIGSKGTKSYESKAFTLQLDNANQVATRLVAKSGPNAGDADFNFLIPWQNRSSNGYLVSVDGATRGSAWSD